jgi:hypothetical protein
MIMIIKIVLNAQKIDYFKKIKEIVLKNVLKDIIKIMINA